MSDGTVEVPTHVIAYYDDYWTALNEYLEQEGIVGEDEHVVAYDLRVRAEQQIEVKNIVVEANKTAEQLAEEN